MTSMRAATYARKSTKTAGREGKSVREQQTVTRALVDAEHWTLVAEHADDGASASRHRRPGTLRAGFDALLALVRDNAIDVVVVWELSRATRDLRVYADLVDTCATHGVRLNVSGRTYDPTRADDRLVLGIGAVVDSAEADRTRERILRSTRAQAASGKPHGRILYGHQRIYDPATGAYASTVPHPERAPVVSEVLERIAAGHTLYSIAADLDARGITPPHTAARWLPTQLRRFATNPSYIGERVHQGEVVGPADWGPIVDVDTWRAANAVITAPARARTAPSTVRHLLTGYVLRCTREGCVGGPFYAFLNRGTHRAYTCRGCFRLTVAAASADEYVRVLVAARLGEESDLWRGRSDDTAASAAWGEVDVLRARLDAFCAQAADGDITPGSLAKIETRLGSRIAAAQARARSLSTPSALAGLDPATAARDWVAWSHDDVPRARNLLAGLVAFDVLPSPGRTRIPHPERRLVPEWLA